MGRQGVLSGDLGGPDGPKDCKKSGGQPLEIDRRGRQVSLDLHVVEAAPEGRLDIVLRDDRATAVTLFTLLNRILEKMISGSKHFDRPSATLKSREFEDGPRRIRFGPSASQPHPGVAVNLLTVRRR